MKHGSEEKVGDVEVEMEDVGDEQFGESGSLTTGPHVSAHFTSRSRAYDDGWVGWVGDGRIDDHQVIFLSSRDYLSTS